MELVKRVSSIAGTIGSARYAFGSLLLACFLMAFTSTSAWAATVPDNANGGFVAEVAAGDVMENNNGQVTVNNGTIVNQFSIVRENNGTIVNNFSFNTNPDKGDGVILNNYLVRKAMTGEGFDLPELWGTNNNFYRVNLSEGGLDWSANPEELQANGQRWVGAPDNETGLAGAVFKAEEGYMITVDLEAETEGFTIADNGDGSYSITVEEGYKESGELDLRSVVRVQALLTLPVSVDPAEGGSVVEVATGEKISSVQFPAGDQPPLLKAVPADGWRFVGWYLNGELYSEDAILRVDAPNRHEQLENPFVATFAKNPVVPPVDPEPKPGEDDEGVTPQPDNGSSVPGQDAGDDGALKPVDDDSAKQQQAKKKAAIQAKADSFPKTNDGSESLVGCVMAVGALMCAVPFAAWRKRQA